jgi:pimeloyl-ACP methyl ester carboxylesterase
MYATVNGVRLAYSDRGQRHKTALLLIHGFPLDHRLWEAQSRGLSALVRVIAADLRGCGRSEVPAGPYSVEQHAADLAALLDYLEVRRAVVAGLSMGGYVALAFWRRHAERVQGLALLDTRAEPDAPPARAARDAAAARAQEIGAETFAQELLPRLLAPVSLARPRVVKRALAMMAAQPVEGIVRTLGALRDRPDSRPTLPTITVPALVLTGEADTLTPPADSAAMAAAIPHARQVIVPGAGHLSPLENPRAVNAALRKFLLSLSPTPPCPRSQSSFSFSSERSTSGRSISPTAAR